MVGLSVLLEARKDLNTSPKVINKITMTRSSSSSSSSSSTTCYSSLPLPAKSFLDECFFCKQRLFPGSDIYMYNGDRAFCSMECRYRQIVMDEKEEEENVKKVNGCFVATPTNSSSSRHGNCKRNKNKVR